MSAPLLDVRGLEVELAGPRGERIHALRGVDLALASGESLALVGASGAGKTTLARAILGLRRASAGRITWTNVDGERTEIAGASERALRSVRREIGVVFQDPFASLDPRRSVRETVGEALFVHAGLRGRALEERVTQSLASVGLAAHVKERAPHQLSGGERQRVAVARAIALRPRLLVLDEAFSALDAATQLELARLLVALRRELACACLHVLHDLTLARRLVEHVAVIHAGRIVEQGPSEDVLVRPREPITRALVASRLALDGAPRAFEAGRAR